jgi:uncharacterized protein (TIGR02145 family)
MKKVKTTLRVIGVFILLFSTCHAPVINTYSLASASGQTVSKNTQTTAKTTQTKSKSTQDTTKSKQATSKTTQTKTMQPASKSKQGTTKSTQTTSKTTQTKSKTTQTTSKSTHATSKTTQTKPKSTQTGSKPVQVNSKSQGVSSKSETVVKAKDAVTVTIGGKTWSIANLNVSTFRNGDTIPEAKTNEEWVAAGAAGKPAWCYYNNDPANGEKYGKLYNWYAVNDPRGLAPAGWTISDNNDWADLADNLGGQSIAGAKMKNSTGWTDGNNGSNISGFTGLPGGYRIENGLFKNMGSIGVWWTTSEGKNLTSYDFYLLQGSNLDRSSSPRQRGESVRCLKK